MTFARITGRRSLRDPVTCCCAQRNGLGWQRRARTAIRADQVIAAREEWSRGPRHNASGMRRIASSPTDNWTSEAMEPSRVLKCRWTIQPTLPDRCWGSGSSGPLASPARMAVARPVVLSEVSPCAPGTSLDHCMPRRNASPVGRARHVQTGCCRLDMSGDDARLRNAKSAASSVAAGSGDAPVGGAICREVSWQLSLKGLATVLETPADFRHGVFTLVFVLDVGRNVVALVAQQMKHFADGGVALPE